MTIRQDGLALLSWYC